MRRTVVFAALAAGLALAAAEDVRAEGLSAVAPRLTLVAGAERVPFVARMTGTPVPLRQGVFIVPFATNESQGSFRSGFARFQAVNSAFQKSGQPGEMISGPENCCSSFAENSGARLASKSMVALPLLVFQDISGDPEAVGRFVAPNGTPISAGVVLNTRHEGTQGAPVIVPLQGGTAYAMWADLFNETGESDASVYGVLLSADGQPVGNGVLLERINTGTQFPTEGVQLADGRILIVFRASGNSEITGRNLFYGRVLKADGRFDGPFFLLGANNDSLFGAQMQVAALPNGNFVAVWIDDRSGEPIPFYRIFSPTGEFVTQQQRVGPFRALSGQFDVAALADGRFVIVGTFSENDVETLAAQLFSAEGFKVGDPFVLMNLGVFEGAPELHMANVGYLTSRAPAPGGLFTATDPRRVYVVWRVPRPDFRYDILGQALIATP